MFSFIARLITFLFVISAIRSVVNYFRRLAAAPPRAAMPRSTTLLQDPVCGTYVAPESSLKKIVKGRVVHFCSAECRDRYNA